MAPNTNRFDIEISEIEKLRILQRRRIPIITITDLFFYFVIYKQGII